jgi:hypothetical protein
MSLLGVVLLTTGIAVAIVLAAVWVAWRYLL